MNNPYPDMEIKSQFKPRGSVTKEEDPKPSYQLYSYRSNLHDQLGILCVCGTYKRSLKALTKENTLVLISVDIEGKNTQE